MASYNDGYFNPNSLRFNNGFTSAFLGNNNDILEEALANLTTE